MPLRENDVAELASEYWKLVRAFERSIALTPEPHHNRLHAQARYAHGKLDSILDRAGVRIATFDGAEFEINLPVTAVNAEDMNSGASCIIERTLEPTIILNDQVVLTGKVFLVEKKDHQ
ncbi:hypothetical protein [Bradyrhizobium ottawaense]|uniref:hypothetical protein n=1 Tax=Bradyrhizobium ottawaense TaxID=931866 RepID=UPI0027F52B3F|nr:hypothetical protein BwSF21_56310 [Bradyrhizobium ottawaense]